ncbi:hypothetical protein [Litchfieldella rifensis]|uniref:Uncharacterized protein n=1 Tax=Litchfieldella rifensis TaxID=762643 RepID=A0ABV7LUV6_9GAMM
MRYDVLMRDIYVLFSGRPPAARHVVRLSRLALACMARWGGSG